MTKTPGKQKCLRLFLTFLLPVMPVKMCLAGQPADSLRAVIVQQKEDTATARALFRYAALLEATAGDSAVYYYRQSLQLSKKLAFWPCVADNYENLCLFLGLSRGELEKGLAMAHEFFNSAVKRGHDAHIARAYLSLGTMHRAIQVQDSATENLFAAAALFEKLNDPQRLATTYSNIAGVFYNMEQPDNALRYLQKAKQVHEAAGSTRHVPGLLINMANILSNKGDFKGAVDSLRKALLLAGSAAEMRMQISIHYNMGDNFEQLRQYDSSLLYLRHAYNLAVGAGYIAFKYKAGLMLALVLNQKEQPAEALGYINSLYSDTANFQMTLRDKRLLHYALAEIYRRQHKYKEALDAYTSFTVCNDSLLKEETRDRMEALDRKYEIAKKDGQIAQKEVQLKKQSLFIQRGITVAVIVCGIILLVWLNANRKRMLRKKEEEVRRQQAELHNMRMVLEGQEKERLRISKEIHDDLGSTLTQITLLTGVLAKKASGQENPELEKLEEMTGGLVKSTNEIIWSLNTGNDNLLSLVAWLRKFAVPFFETAGMVFSFEAPGQIPVLAVNGHDRHNIYLAVKEAVNNIVKHAGATEARITIQLQAGHLVITISDNGRGIDESSPAGNGLENMRARMAGCGGSMAVTNNNGTRIQLTLPL